MNVQATKRITSHATKPQGNAESRKDGSASYQDVTSGANMRGVVQAGRKRDFLSGNGRWVTWCASVSHVTWILARHWLARHRALAFIFKVKEERFHFHYATKRG